MGKKYRLFFHHKVLNGERKLFLSYQGQLPRRKSEVYLEFNGSIDKVIGQFTDTLGRRREFKKASEISP